MDNGYQEIKSSPDGTTCHNIKIPTLLRLTMLGIVVITPAITPGMSIGYPAVALPQLNLSLSEMSWFASIASISCPVGNFVTGLIIDRYGRRPSLIVSIIPSIIGWFILSRTDYNAISLYTGRIFTGFALGVASLPSNVYVAECITINNVNLRGSLTTWTTVSLYVGTVLVYLLGSLLSCIQVAEIAAVISTISLILMLVFIPESPAWLYRKGRIGDAEWSQKRLGIYQPILLTPTDSVSDYRSENDTKSFSWQEFLQYLDKFKRKDVYKPLIITILFLFFLQFSGVHVLTTYMVIIISYGNEVQYFSPYVLTVIAGIIQLLAVTLISFIIPYSGIRKLSIISCIGVTFGMCLLAFSLTCKLLDDKYMFALHVIAVWITVFASGLGFIAIPFAVLGELFPTDAKGFASISLIASSIFNFIILKAHPYLATYFLGSVYYLYTFVNIIGTIFIALFLPETVGKTLDEIKSGFLNIPTITVTKR